MAEDAAVVGFIASLPPAKRQPNLLFAAARYLLGAPPGMAQLRELVSQSPAGLAEVILARRTQTNEPARCATLVIHHTAVLYCVPPDQRAEFASMVRRLGAVWLSSEAPGVLPGTAGPAPGADPLTLVLARDRHAFASADSHGAWLEWRR